MNSQLPIDVQLRDVAAEIRNLDPKGCRTAQVLRDSIDQLYDGQRTGRYKWNQLYSTEKRQGGRLVELNLHREFKFQDGQKLNCRIAGADVDCKYSQTIGDWAILPEAEGHLCLLLWAEDNQNPTWSMGLVRITPDRLNSGSNRDSKSTLNERWAQLNYMVVRESRTPPKRSPSVREHNRPKNHDPKVRTEED